MKFAQTIAMARNLLADGRAEDVVRMIEPLLAPSNEDGAAGAGQALLRALMARVHVIHTGNAERALALLAPFEEAAVRNGFTAPTRAALMLWLGWAHARRDETFDEEARALNLLDEARRLFAAEPDTGGRCWALVGQAQAYFSIDEYELMRQALNEAAALQPAVGDAQLDRWIHDLRVPALRFQGRYDEAQQHVDALMAIGTEAANREVIGRAHAYRAALQLDRGHPPERIISTAEQAEALLHRTPHGVGYPLLAAYHAHIRALMLQGAWPQAATTIDAATANVGSHPTARAHLQTLRARLALRQCDPEEAEAVMEDLFAQAHHLPHGLQRSHVALLRGELLARKGRHDEARHWMERAYRNACETGHRGNQLLALLTRAEAALDHGDADTSALLRTIERYDDYFSVLPFAARRFRILGRHAQRSGDRDEARTYFNQSLSAYSLIGDALRTAEMQCILAEPDAETPARARPLLAAAAATFERLGATDAAQTARTTLEALPTTDEAAAPTFESTFESIVGAALARASLSVRLVAEAWIRAVEALLPGRWIGVYRRSTGDTWTCVHEHGVPPAALSFPAAPAEQPKYTGRVCWHPIQTNAPSDLYMGVAVSRPDDPAWHAAAPRLKPWLPVVQLALDHALLGHRPPHGTPPMNGVDRTAARHFPNGFVYDSPALRTIAQTIDRIRASHSPALIVGETGVGKTTVAHAIHATSGRSDGPWQTINCARVPPDPLAARLFGRGTSTPGLIEQTDGGTLLLQEIDTLPLPLQRRLLRVLEASEVTPIDAEQPVPVDVRLLASTTEDLLAQIRDGQFRDDLYYRLNVISLSIPPLRERREDISLLARHFLDTLRPAGTPPVSLTNRALDALLRYDWPGNVRQLRNEIERALVFVSSEPAPTVDIDLLSEALQTEPAAQASPRDNGAAILHPDRDLSDLLARTEKTIIERVLTECEGHITASADVLGLTRQGLYKKMKRLDIDPAAFKHDAPPSPVPN